MTGERLAHAPFLLICPTHRDRRELRRIGLPDDRLRTHTYASDALERLAGAQPGVAVTIADPLDEIERIVARFGDEPLCGVVSADDYPGSTLACIVARRLGLPGPDPAANLLLQHKFHAREAQARLTPEATPPYALLDPAAPLRNGLEFPMFVKPVKSFFSIGAQAVASSAELLAADRRWRGKEAFLHPFRRLFEAYAGRPMGAGHLIAEGLLRGRQVTLEGYVHRGAVEVLGVVDSVFTPGTIAFKRFEYPSNAPEPLQHRMIDIARRLISGVAYDSGMFNIEFIYDADGDRVGIVEVNPRMASQFADLYEKVDGFNSYEVLLDLAAGRRPRPRWREGAHAFAASCVLRAFADAVATWIPEQSHVDEALAAHPDARIEILTAAGRRLSDDMQDGQSFRYGVINLGGRDRADVLAKLSHCERLLPFHWEACEPTEVPRASGAGSP